MSATPAPTSVMLKDHASSGGPGSYGDEFHCTAEYRDATLQARWLVQKKRDPFLKVHCLDRPTVIYLPRSNIVGFEGCFDIRGNSLAFRTFGTAVLLPRNVPLYIVSRGTSERGMLVCHFAPAAFAAPALEGVPELQGFNDMRSPPVIDALERMTLEVRQDLTARTEIVSGLALVLLGEIRRYLLEAGSREAGAGALAAWQHWRIEKRLTDDTLPLPDIAELASLCGIGVRQLQRAWRADTGIPVGKRIRRTRFTRALHWVTSSKMSMKTIAARLGYRDGSSFSTAFCHHFGGSPTSIRKKIGPGGTIP